MARRVSSELRWRWASRRFWRTRAAGESDGEAGTLPALVSLVGSWVAGAGAGALARAAVRSASFVSAGGGQCAGY